MLRIISSLGGIDLDKLDTRSTGVDPIDIVACTKRVKG